MRVELIYAPGCSSYKKARNTLETVIAEEGLPVPVELVEEHSQIHGEPTLRINGNVVHASPVSQHMEHFRYQQAVAGDKPGSTSQDELTTRTPLKENLPGCGPAGLFL
jgi:hypothetical protein